ncbi:MAG TPA: hypothetical protein VN618_02805 [Solirubrobacteraceae bacterium]|nr:hypothetical protein [Solirubrobacteraceae bacterium]
MPAPSSTSRAERSRFGARRAVAPALALALVIAAGTVPAVGAAGARWVKPPPVLGLPSRSGAEGPPRPYGFEPGAGPAAPRTAPGFVRAQDRAMLDGPFPAGGLRRGVSDGTLFKSADPARRRAALALARDAGAAIARISVDWRNVAPAAPPPGFDARDPASPGYDFTALDAAVRDAADAGLEPLLAVFHAPAFAEAPNRWPHAFDGSWDPDPAALEAFAAALAERYGGSWPDPSAPGRTLPRVRLWQAWNEPNLARYLEPQWIVSGGRWRAFSPLLYRQLLDGFYRGVKSVAPGDVVAAAGVAPNGDRAGVGRMAPVTFLRGLLCLTSGPHGVLRRGHGCGGPVDLDALAFHPLSVGSPDLAATSALDVAISDAGKVAALARAAVRLRTVAPARPTQLWVTELNWESSPPATAGVPPALQAPWLSRALHRLWSAGVDLVAWQFLIDPFPALTVAAPDGGVVSYQRPAGLYSPGPGGDPTLAQAKPFVSALRLPFDPLRLDRRRVRVWALARPSGGPPPASARALLQARGADGAWRTVATIAIGRDGVVDAVVRLRGALRLRLQAGGVLSAEAALGTRRSLPSG